LRFGKLGDGSLKSIFAVVSTELSAEIAKKNGEIEEFCRLFVITRGFLK